MLTWRIASCPSRCFLASAPLLYMPFFVRTPARAKAPTAAIHLLSES
jgi:hypothetical protein